MSQKLNILCLLVPPLRDHLMKPSSVQRLEAVANVTWLRSGAVSSKPDTWETDLRDVHVIMGSWGMPRFDNHLLDLLTSLELVAHGAGSVKPFVTPGFFERGIRVTHGASVIAQSVGEWCLMAALVGLRRAVAFHEVMREDGWKVSQDGHGDELAGKRIGLLAMSQTARAFLKLLKPFGCDVRVYDPYLADDDATNLGVGKEHSIDALCAWADIISNHVPATPETSNLVKADQFALMRDGTLVINSARPAAIDYPALIAELRSGRLRAALDVFPEEPVKPGDPVRYLPNVLVTPHIAGATWDGRARLGETMVDEIIRFAAGEQLRHEVHPDRLATMA